MAQTDINHWNERYRSGNGPRGQGADRRLAPYADPVNALHTTLVARGETPTALDVACGAGGTLVWLARNGWHVTGVDASSEALQLAASAVQSARCDQRCKLTHADLDHWRPTAGSYDLVTCFFFLDRALLPALRDAVCPGGLLILETWNRHWLAYRPQSNPAYLLSNGELEEQISHWQWTILTAHSDGPGVDHPTSAIVAQRPPRFQTT